MAGHTDFVLDLATRDVILSECFSDARMAAATCCLARHAKNRNPNPTVHSIKLYNKALLSVRSALADRCSIREDATLVAIILLSMTGMTEGNDHRLNSPHHRVQLALADLRSAEDCSDRSLTGRIVNYVYVNATTRDLFFPSSSGPAEQVGSHQPSKMPKDFRNLFYHTSIAGQTLRHAIRTRSTGGPKAARRVLELFTYLQGFEHLLPPHFHRNTVIYKGQSAFYYGNSTMAGIWLSLWSAQSRLSEMLFDYLEAWPDLELKEEFDSVNQSDACSPTEGIFACIPFMLGEIDNKGCPIDVPPLNPGPMLLANALFVVGNARHAAITARRPGEIFEYFLYVAHDRGVGQALVFREELRATRMVVVESLQEST